MLCAWLALAAVSLSSPATAQELAEAPDVAAAEAAVADAFQIGMDAYNRGDLILAMEWFRKAAEQGEARAQMKLGLMYQTGGGVAQDDKEAVKWYRKAAENGIAAG